MNLRDNPSFIDFTTFKPHPLSKAPSTAVEGDLDRDLEVLKLPKTPSAGTYTFFEGVEGTLDRDLDFSSRPVSKAASTAVEGGNEKDLTCADF